jgi:hypothetical protein
MLSTLATHLIGQPSSTTETKIGNVCEVNTASKKRETGTSGEFISKENLVARHVLRRFRRD